MPVYPGIYQAKATKVNNLGVEVLIPQVFGEAPITVQRFMVGPPTSVGLGWVMFVAGNPEFPVWCSGINALIQSGDTPAFEDVNEVWVGPSTPTDPDIELWVDSDAGATTYAKVDGAWVPITTASGGTDEVWIGDSDPIDTHPTIELWYDPDTESGGGTVVARMQLWNWAGEETTALARGAEDPVAEQQAVVPLGDVGIPGPPSQAVEVRISRLDSTLQVDWSYRIGTLRPGDRIYLQYAPDAGSWHLYDVTGTPTQLDTDTWSIPVATVAGSPPGTAPPVGAQVYIQWSIAAGAATSSYVHHQGSSSDTWVIDHNLGYYPNFIVEDSGGATIEGEPTYNSINRLTISFSAAFAGVAYLS